LRDVQRILQPELPIREFELGRIVREYFPAAPGIVIARLAIDGNTHVDAFAVTLARGGCERRFERLENDLLVDALLVGDCVNDHQNLFVHRCELRFELIYICGATRALCIPSIGSVTLPPSTFNVISRSVASSS